MSSLIRSFVSFAIALSIPTTVRAADKPAPAKAVALPLSGSIQFIGSKVTGSHTGDFKDWKGSLALKAGKLDGARLEFTIQMDKFECDAGNRNAFTEKLEGHLKGPDFFDVAKFPTATFASTDIKAGGERGATHTITGNLTIRGVTKKLTFPATLSDAGKQVTGKTEFSINRKDFGIAYAGKADDLIRDGVVLKIDVSANR